MTGKYALAMAGTARMCISDVRQPPEVSPWVPEGGDLKEGSSGDGPAALEAFREAKPAQS